MRQLIHDRKPRCCPNYWLVKSFQAIPGSSKVVFPKGRHDMQVKSFSQNMTSINSHLRNARKRMLRSSTLSSVNFFSKLRILFERSTTSTMQLWILHSTHTRAYKFFRCSHKLVLGWESNTNQRRPSEWTSVRKVLTLKQPNYDIQCTVSATI